MEATLMSTAPKFRIDVDIHKENALAFGEIRELKDKLAQEKLYLEDELRGEMNFAQIVGKSVPLRRVLKKVETVATTDSTVLIYGETGTGKELIARAIHDLSPRRTKPFVKVNCAAIPTGLLESELFGHEKGAFTGLLRNGLGVSKWPTAAPFSWMKSEKFLSNCKPNCYASCKKVSPSGLEARARSGLMRA
jgi:transcriptional regulator with PAS, ATPase and Fis domain